jgi:hypothetical protein
MHLAASLFDGLINLYDALRILDEAPPQRGDSNPVRRWITSVKSVEYKSEPGGYHE